MSGAINTNNRHVSVDEDQITNSGVITVNSVINVEKCAEIEVCAQLENLIENCTPRVTVEIKKSDLQKRNDINKIEMQQLQAHNAFRENIVKNSLNNNNLNLTQVTSNDFGLNVLRNVEAATASSPPPHSYRQSRAYRHFKNPPQPHMCIRTTTESGEELFINVLSWTRIVIPQEPSDPIPLYGGMRVAPGSPRNPPIVFAVMANPEVLKDSGRHSKDPEERHAMVELMCDFVEAMNPGVKLKRNAVILKDRDISGELKDVWNAVQTQRDREREEQLIQQRQQQQQQHFHNLLNVTNNNGSSSVTTQQLFPKFVNNLEAETSSPSQAKKVIMNSTMTTDSDTNTKTQLFNEINDTLLLEQQSEIVNNTNACGNIEYTDKKNVICVNTKDIKQKTDTEILACNINGKTTEDQENAICPKDRHQTKISITSSVNCSGKTVTAMTESLVNENISNTPIAVNSNNCINSPYVSSTIIDAATSTCTTTVTKTRMTPAKKEKLGGFLPNGCIFPRFKNHKHKDKEKDKDKDKDKEIKVKEKEKNVLLYVLKPSKSKEKKANINNHYNQSESKRSLQQEQQHVNDTNMSKSNNNPSMKNNLKQIECELHKLDINTNDSY